MLEDIKQKIIQVNRDIDKAKSNQRKRQLLKYKHRLENPVKRLSDYEMIKTIDEKYHLTERYRVHKYAKEMAEKYRKKWETK